MERAQPGATPTSSLWTRLLEGARQPPRQFAFNLNGRSFITIYGMVIYVDQL
jgi:hypothetical protein